MLILARAAQAEVVRAAESARAVGLVAPTSPTGWSAFYGEVGRADALTTHLPGEVQVVDSGQAQAPLERDQEALGDEGERLEGALAAVGLRPLLPTARARELVVVRGDHAAARAAASLLGDTWALDLGKGWLALWSAQERTPIIAAVMKAVGRRDQAVGLWQEGPAAGATIRVRSAEHQVSWSTGWWTVLPDALCTGPLLQAAAQINPVVDRSHLRAVLRRQDDRHGLDELVELLDLPPAALDALRGQLKPAEAGAEFIDKTTAPSPRGGVSHPRAAAAPHRLRRLRISGTAKALTAVLATVLATLSVVGWVRGDRSQGWPMVANSGWWVAIWIAVALIAGSTAFADLRRANRLRPVQRDSERDSSG